MHEIQRIENMIRLSLRQPCWCVEAHDGLRHQIVKLENATDLDPCTAERLLARLREALDMPCSDCGGDQVWMPGPEHDSVMSSVCVAVLQMIVLLRKTNQWERMGDVIGEAEVYLRLATKRLLADPDKIESIRKTLALGDHPEDQVPSHNELTKSELQELGLHDDDG